MSCTNEIMCCCCFRFVSYLFRGNVENKKKKKKILLLVEDAMCNYGAHLQTKSNSKSFNRYGCDVILIENMDYLAKKFFLEVLIA